MSEPSLPSREFRQLPGSAAERVACPEGQRVRKYQAVPGRSSLPWARRRAAAAAPRARPGHRRSGDPDSGS